MKKFYLLILAGAAFATIHSQNFSWAKREGGWAYDYGYSICNDNSGNVYAAGKFEMNANFSGTILPCDDCNHDIWIAQYSSSGNLNWIRTAGGHLGDYAHDISCDNNFVYMAGEIEGPQMLIQFNGSPITLTTYSQNDAVLAKYDVNGNLMWAQKAGWYQDDKGMAVANDNSGNVFMGGFFNDTAMFGTNTFIYGYGNNDVFVSKYDANGNFQWVQKAGSPNRDEVKGMKCDAAGNVYVIGMFSDGCVFGNQTLHCTPGYFDIFLAKYDPNGNLLWVKTAGGDYDDVAWGITMDNSGKIYITGEYNAYALFGNIGLATVGMADVFVACYYQNGNVQWAKSAGGSMLNRGRGIGTDGTNIYITGQFGATANFGNNAITAADSSDIFMARVDNAGNFTWAMSVGGMADSLEPLGYESGIAITGDASSGAVYTTGSQLTDAAFGSTTLQNYSRTDVFVTKITQQNVNAVAEINSSDEFSVYPNPALGEFWIMNPKNEKCDFKMIDVYGQNVCTGKIVNTLTSVNPNIAAGVYFIEINADNKVYRKQIVHEQ